MSYTINNIDLPLKVENKIKNGLLSKEEVRALISEDLMENLSASSAIVMAINLLKRKGKIEVVIDILQEIKKILEKHNTGKNTGINELIQSLNNILNSLETTKLATEKPIEGEQTIITDSNEVASYRIEDLNILKNTKNILLSNGIQTVSELLNKFPSTEELIKHTKLRGKGIGLRGLESLISELDRLKVTHPYKKITLNKSTKLKLNDPVEEWVAKNQNADILQLKCGGIIGISILTAWKISANWTVKTLLERYPDRKSLEEGGFKNKEINQLAEKLSKYKIPHNYN